MEKLDDSNVQINKGFGIIARRDTILKNKSSFKNPIETRESKHIEGQIITLNLYSILTQYDDTSIIDFVDHCINLTPHAIKYVLNGNLIFKLNQREDYTLKLVRKPIKDDIIMNTPVAICRATSHHSVKVKKIEYLSKLIECNRYVILICSTLTVKCILKNLTDKEKEKVIILSPNTGPSCKRDAKGNVKHITMFIYRYGNLDLLK